jgi:phosphatidylserine/phosphatidylglycerophosphate/cardiolipin synthase-like enzyme
MRRIPIGNVSVRGCPSGSRYSAATYLSNAGVPVSVDTRIAIAHSKVMVIDAETVITGSFNFTATAQSHNSENLLAVRDATLAARYRADWERGRLRMRSGRGDPSAMGHRQQDG